MKSKAQGKMKSKAPAKNTKQTKPKKDPRKPKRPLSAFNLFYRYKRTHVLEALSQGKISSKAEIIALVGTPSGLDATAINLPPSEVSNARRANIRRDLGDNLLPRDTRDRRHRKNAMNGTMSFVELGRVMNNAWKNCDQFARDVFQELADEGREVHRRRVHEYRTECELQPKIVGKSAGKRTEELDAKKPRSVPSIEVRAAKELSAAVAKRGIDTMSEGMNIGTTPSIPLQYLGSHLQSLPIPSTSSVATDIHLRSRLHHLEHQLAEERLRARARELECSLLRERAVEERLRTTMYEMEMEARRVSHDRAIYDKAIAARQYAAHFDAVSDAAASMLTMSKDAASQGHSYPSIRLPGAVNRRQHSQS